MIGHWIGSGLKQTIKSFRNGRNSRGESARRRAALFQAEELEGRIVPTLLGQPLFPANYPTNNSIVDAPVSNSSATWIGEMSAARSHLIVNWGAYTPGSGGSLYSMPYNIVHSKDTTNYTQVKVYIDNYPGESDLTGTDPSQGNRPYVLVPMPKVNPQNLFIEGDGQNGADASRFTSGGSDSHLIIWDADTNTDYEFWETSRPSESSLVPGGYYGSTAIANQWNAANEATWNMSADSFRTLGYTSGDAAGLPILNNIVRPDEALPSAEGGQSTTPAIDHAIRFTLPSSLISKQYTYPASHVAAGSGGIPYGTRFRLENTPTVNNLIAEMGPESQVIARAMQQYGLILADIGSAMFVQGAATSVDTNDNPIIDPTTGKPITWNMNDLTPDAVSGTYTVGLDSIPTSDFDAVNPVPQVTGLSVSSGQAGSTITITGEDFSGSAGNLSVLFVPPGNNPPYTSNGQVTTLKAGVVAAAANTITIVDGQHIQVVVPSGTGTVDVQVLSGQLLDDTYNGDYENATAPIFGYGISQTSTADQFTYTGAPAITTQPMSETLTAGQTASFTAAASGSPAPTVQWQMSTNSGSTWNNISGATAATYSFTSSASQNGYEYRAVFTNSGGSATTYAAALNLSPTTAGPSVTTQPGNQTVSSGQSATFTALANGSPAPTVQWQVSADSGSTWNNVAVATSTTLTVPAASVQNGNQYRAVFNNNLLINGDFEGTTYTDGTTGDIMPNGWVVGPPSPSTLSKLNVASAINAPTDLGPESGTDYMRFQSTANNGSRDCLYQDLNTVAGQTYTVSFWVAITSTSAGNNLGLDPIWDENRANQATMGNAFYLTPSNTGPVNYQFFSFTETASASTTRIDFHGIDSNGSILLDNMSVIATAISNPAILTVSGSSTPPSVTTQPSNQTVTAGQMATFTAASGGSPVPTIQWQMSTNGGANWSNISAATSATYSIANTILSQSGTEYRAVFTNSAGTATTNAATLTVNVASATSTVTFQQGVAGYAGGVDAGIDTQYAIYNGGNGVQYLNQPTLEIGTDSTGDVFETLLRFTNLTVPANDVVTAASVTLTIVDYTGGTSVTGYYVNNAWSTTDATIGWIHRGNGLNWASPGALGQGTDLVAGKSFALPTTNASGAQVFTISLDPSVVQSWLANPSADQGILLVTNAARTVNVDTAENATVSSRPLLSITITPPTPAGTLTGVPNPATLPADPTYTMMITGSNPTGSVTFTDYFNGNTATTTVSVTNTGTATYTPTYVYSQAGTHTITAAYGGDSNNGPLTKMLTETINPPPVPAVVGPAAVNGASGNPTLPGGAAWSTQISRVSDIVINFNTPVNIGAGAITLTRAGLPNGAAGDQVVVTPIVTVNGSTVTLTFGSGASGTTVPTGDPAALDNGSLGDGNWTLNINHALVSSTVSGAPAMSANYSQAGIRRLFGLVAPGGTIVDSTDYAALAHTYGLASNQTGYNAALDFSGTSALIGAADITAFGQRFGESI